MLISRRVKVLLLIYQYQRGQIGLNGVSVAYNVEAHHQQQAQELGAEYVPNKQGRQQLIVLEMPLKQILLLAMEDHQQIVLMNTVLQDSI